jgi:hypothetical protein
LSRARLVLRPGLRQASWELEACGDAVCFENKKASPEYVTCPELPGCLDYMSFDDHGSQKKIKEV